MLNMSWNHPDLYFFLGLLTGLAAFLAIVYECIQTFRRRKLPVVEPSRSTVDPPSRPKKYLDNVKPLDGLQRDCPRPTEAGKPAAERFSGLCESIEDLSPKEQNRSVA
jgi:hypothetical protein